MDIKNPSILKLKGLLFLMLGLMAAGLIIIESPHLRTLGLLLIVIWAFCRFYYFAFYVMHHYADKNFNYSGLVNLIGYLLGGRK